MIWLLPGIPLLTGAISLLRIPRSWRRALLVFAAVSHSALTALAFRFPDLFASHGWLALDKAGHFFLAISSVLFLITTLHLVTDCHYLSGSETRSSDWFLATEPSATLAACLNLFLATMTLCALSRHLGLLWVAVEGTTLATAPLIHYRRDSSSLEATWKYLVLCSVGIAVALLGNFFVAAAGGEHAGLSLDSLRSNAASLNPVWLKAAFVFFIVGYGTKMGLAPMHTWLPDAHSEAPAPVSALLSGALLNCAFLAVLRAHAVLAAAGLADFSKGIFVLFGVISLVVAAFFIVGQGDYKRLLAYSSVENMGILSIAVGVGAGFGGLFHALNHSLVKGGMFLLAGGILSRCGSTSVRDARGLSDRARMVAGLWLTGFLALSGLPPFGIFFSKLAILKTMIDGGHWLLTTLFLAALAIVFIAMSRIVLLMLFDKPEKGFPTQRSRIQLDTLAPLLLLLLALATGIFLPESVGDLIRAAAQEVGL
ncbi:NADH dehydrogenase FAD-containing subunit [bacterium]|nr:NADH dehydrogenase FAD-containing subunit [bacterium]